MSGASPSRPLGHALLGEASQATSLDAGRQQQRDIPASEPAAPDPRLLRLASLLGQTAARENLRRRRRRGYSLMEAALVLAAVAAAMIIGLALSH